MLELLHIENIAVIESADIAFQPGFNALTGETGAGKSIVIDAIGAVLGERYNIGRPGFTGADPHRGVQGVCQRCVFPRFGEASGPDGKRHRPG